MNKIILIPDSFKGTMSAAQVGDILARAVSAHFPRARVVSIPMADGGEGTVDAFLAAAGGQKISCPATGPTGAPLTASYGLLPDGDAIVEMAACAGLPLMGDALDPLGATTAGVGALVLDAARRGARRILMGLGGSATNDGGCGAAAAVGVRFWDVDGSPFVPTGGTLHRIARIDTAALDPALKGVTFAALCDIDNPLLGARGAARAFGPQKGADEAQISLIEAGLAHLAQVIETGLGCAVADIPGAGAAGGMGAGMVAFLGAALQSGIDTLLDAAGFEAHLPDADLVITGEGRIDGQSLGGKAVVGVARRAKAAGVPVVALVGDIGDGIAPVYTQGVTAVFSTNRQALDFSRVRGRAPQDLFQAADNLMRLLAATR